MREPDHQKLASLVVLTKQNDNDAFATLYALTCNKVYNYARHYLRDDFLAQDAVQEVYISVLKNIYKLNDPMLFTAWLNQISFHVCFDISQKQSKAGMTSLEDEILYSLRDEHPDSDPEHHFISKDEHHRLQAAISSLPFHEQQCILMKYYNHMKLDEIAETLDISKSTVKRYILHAQAALQKRLKQ